MCIYTYIYILDYIGILYSMAEFYQPFLRRHRIFSSVRGSSTNDHFNFADVFVVQDGFCLDHPWIVSILMWGWHSCLNMSQLMGKDGKTLKTIGDCAAEFALELNDNIQHVCWHSAVLQAKMAHDGPNHTHLNVCIMYIQWTNIYIYIYIIIFYPI